MLTEEEQKQIEIRYQITSDSIKEEVGVVEVYLNDTLLGSVKIYQNIEEEKTSQKENFLVRFLRWLFRW